MDECKSVAYGLKEDLQISNASFTLFFHVREMIRARSSISLLAQDFFWLTMHSLRDSAVVRLWKVYDSQPSAHSLSWFIQNHSTLDKVIQRADRDFLSVKNDGVKRLARLRNQIFAHRGREVAERGEASILQSQNLSETEFTELIDSALHILRKHFGEGIPNRLPHDPYDAVSQIADLDVYLIDVFRGFGGLQRYPRVIDGDVKGSVYLSDDF